MILQRNLLQSENRDKRIAQKNSLSWSTKNDVIVSLRFLNTLVILLQVKVCNAVIFT